MSDIPTPTVFDPVVLAGSNNRDMTDHVCGLATRSRAFLWWWIAIAPFAILTGVLLVSRSGCSGKAWASGVSTGR